MDKLWFFERLRSSLKTVYWVRQRKMKRLFFCLRRRNSGLLEKTRTAPTEEYRRTLLSWSLPGYQCEQLRATADRFLRIQLTCWTHRLNHCRFSYRRAKPLFRAEIAKIFCKRQQMQLYNKQVRCAQRKIAEVQRFPLTNSNGVLTIQP